MDNTNKKMTVLVTDDHPVYRKGIVRILGNIPFIEKILEAENGFEAIKILENNVCDIVLLDLHMPVMDGLEASRVILNKFRYTKIIILTMSDSQREMVELLDMGVTGYVLKSTDEAELTLAIQRVSEGNQYLSKEVDDAWTQFLGNKSKFEKRFTKIEKIDLSEREIEIIRMICKQKSTQEIAELLSLSVNTVKTHRNNIMKKLDTDNVVGVAIYAVRAGLFIP